MHLTVSLIIAGMVLFSVISAVRERLLYRSALRGNTQFLISKRRLQRRLFVSVVLILEGTLLYLGFFVLTLDSPFAALLFWTSPMLLIGLLVYLSILDYRETSRDIDRIFLEASNTIRDKIKQQKSGNSDV